MSDQPRTVESVINGLPARVVLDAERQLQMIGTPEFLAGYSSGWSAGLEEGICRGRRLADDEAAARFRRAHSIVQAIAKIPTHDELEAIRKPWRRPEAAA